METISVDSFSTAADDSDVRAGRIMTDTTADARPRLDHNVGACDLKLFVYDSLLTNNSNTLKFGRYFSNTTVDGQKNCLISTCQYNDFSRANVRVFTSDVPVYLELRKACPIVNDPAEADAFIVPALMGTVTTAAWCDQYFGNATERRVEQNKLATARGWFWHALPHLNASTAHKQCASN